jgi:hypothetical protein
MELEMEIDRLKDLSERERVEEDKRSRRIADREVIVGQIQYRSKLKMLAEEQRERDNQAMLKQMAKYAEEDAVKAAQHKIEVEKSKVEIMKANAESIERKKAARAAEIAEVEALRVYQAKRDAEMARREKEEEDIANEKREQQKKLLAQQEKVQSGQAEVDELRARRYAEERERKARNEERSKAQKKHSQMLELMASRKSQAEAKQSMMAREAVMQQQEYEDGLKYSMGVMKREKAEAAVKHAKVGLRLLTVDMALFLLHIYFCLSVCLFVCLSACRFFFAFREISLCVAHFLFVSSYSFVCLHSPRSTA